MSHASLSFFPDNLPSCLPQAHAGKMSGPRLLEQQSAEFPNGTAVASSVTRRSEFQSAKLLVLYNCLCVSGRHSRGKVSGKALRRVLPTS